jgi:hypothetical protein
MASSGFYDAGLLRQLATNLFYGWGYNFYRLENQLRADDQLVRTKAASLLGIAMASANDAEAEYRREFLRPPSRQHPFPDADAVATAQRLERLVREIGALEGLIQQQPAPGNDRMTQRYRNEAATLTALIQHDEQLVGQCELLRTMVTGKSAGAILQDLPNLQSGLEAIRTTLRHREAILLDPAR